MEQASVMLPLNRVSLLRTDRRLTCGELVNVRLGNIVCAPVSCSLFPWTTHATFPTAEYVDLHGRPIVPHPAPSGRGVPCCAF